MVTSQISFSFLNDNEDHKKLKAVSLLKAKISFLLHEKLLVDLDWPESKHIHVPSINVFAKTGMGLELWPVELSNEKLPIPLTESKTLASQY